MNEGRFGNLAHPVAAFTPATWRLVDPKQARKLLAKHRTDHICMGQSMVQMHQSVPSQMAAALELWCASSGLWSNSSQIA